ncbi:hypothetical protein ACQPW3_18030 [Actinosynnema sp. CA-248983]
MPPLHRPVWVNYELFERMRYVCFHYQFEHLDADPDGDCGAPRPGTSGAMKTSGGPTPLPERGYEYPSPASTADFGISTDR